MPFGGIYEKIPEGTPARRISRKNFKINFLVGSSKELLEKSQNVSLQGILKTIRINPRELSRINPVGSLEVTPGKTAE